MIDDGANTIGSRVTLKYGAAQALVERNRRRRQRQGVCGTDRFFFRASARSMLRG